MRVVLIGPPGSGKATQAHKLAKHYRVACLLSGQILSKSEDPQIQKSMRNGEAVADDIIIDLLDQRLKLRDTNAGFIMAGFPHGIGQAQELDSRLAWVNRAVEVVLHFNLDFDIARQRLRGRLVCDRCGTVYHVDTAPPASTDICDQCGNTLQHRANDNQQSINLRLEDYHKKTVRLVDYYSAQQKLRTIDPTQPATQIFKQLCDVLDEELNPLSVSVSSRTAGNKIHHHESASRLS